MSTNTFSQMLATRPARLPRAMEDSNAKIAGVCEGIGFRFQIDPLLLRVIFVGLSFIGIGPLLYCTLWWLMPRYPLETSPAQSLLQYPDAEKERASRLRAGGWIGLAVVGAGWMFFMLLARFIALIGIVVIGALWWLLYLRHPDQPQALTPEVRKEAAPVPHRRRWPWVTAVCVLMIGTGAAIAIAQSSLFESHYEHVDQASALESEYTSDFGSMNLDLQDLQPLKKSQTVLVQSRYGNAGVILPNKTNYELECLDGNTPQCQSTTHKGKGALLTIKVSSGRFGHAWVE
ncbi:PspC domain-containing protein [Corynebacterium pseudopelargi]|nr:PspC domain-containing protein [Corynebacterium pseudopelargi]